MERTHSGTGSPPEGVKLPLSPGCEAKVLRQGSAVQAPAARTPQERVARLVAAAEYLLGVTDGLWVQYHREEPAAQEHDTFKAARLRLRHALEELDE